jgi:hypothetical protein
MPRAPLPLLSLIGLLCMAACSPTPPWVDGGLTLTLPGNGVVSGRAVSALLTNNTGGVVSFGDPGCFYDEQLVGRQWQPVDSMIGRTCTQEIINLDNGRSFAFAFRVPTTPGIYRFVLGTGNAASQSLTLHSPAVTVP